MSTPVAIANAFSDALKIKYVKLPLTNTKVHQYLNLNKNEKKPKHINKHINFKNYPINGSGEFELNIDQINYGEKYLILKIWKQLFLDVSL